jgi:hypothetical protein
MDYMTKQPLQSNTSKLLQIIRSHLVLFSAFLLSTVLMLLLMIGQLKPNGDVFRSKLYTSKSNNVPLIIPTLSQLPAYPLEISSNNRFLVDQNKQPFFLVGDAAWSLIVQLTKPEVDYYLSNRQQKGFNTLLVNLVDHQFASNAPRNIYGDHPFTSTPFITPNEAYFANADYVISAAAQKGINVLLAPLYLGYNCGPEGWCSEVQAASLSDMTFWGQYIGNRYKDYPNIIWVIGGDTNPSRYPGVQEKVDAFVAGLKQYDNVHLITAHNTSGEMAVTPWAGVSWLTLNNIYTDNQTYPLAQTAYNFRPTLPFFTIEGDYENEHGMTQQQLRAEGYWTFLSGGVGYVFGNCPVWHFGATNGWCDRNTIGWKESLDSPGSVDMSYMWTLFTSRPWQYLEPDWNHSVVTSGYGSFGKSGYVTASMTPDGNLAIVYIPNKRTITVDMSRFLGMVTARWYDPANGTYTSVSASPLNNSGTKKFTSPGFNSAGDRDWVLVLESGLDPTSTSILPDTTSTPSFSETPNSISTKTLTPVPVVTSTPTDLPSDTDTLNLPYYFLIIFLSLIGLILIIIFLIWIWKRLNR